MYATVLAALLILLSAMPGAHADGDAISPERARAAMKSGEIKPLSALILQVEKRYNGHLIEAELRDEGGLLTYEFEFLPPDGVIFQIILNARTGETLRTSGPVQEKR